MLIVATYSQPHVHNMDGFFFCKLKVNPVQSKAAEAKGEIESSDKTDVKPKHESSNGLEMTVFNDEEDAALIAKSQQKHGNKKKQRTK